MFVVFILWSWSAGAGHSLAALARMVVQLLLIGYLLVYIFEADVSWIVLAVMTVMVIAASWIALRTIPQWRGALYGYAFVSILIGGGLTVALVTQAVLTLDPWYQPSFMVPLAGMIFAASMNSVSLAAERMLAELRRGVSYVDARRIAMQAGLIPIVNTLFAVGLVSLPGLMTGQILSGVSPLIAVRYQVMVMCMIFGASGMSAAIFLTLLRQRLGHQLDSGQIAVESRQAWPSNPNASPNPASPPASNARANSGGKSTSRAPRSSVPTPALKPSSTWATASANAPARNSQTPPSSISTTAAFKPPSTPRAKPSQKAPPSSSKPPS
jgi:putative ABC transport system permease protein